MYMRITIWRALSSQYVKYNAWHESIALALAMPYSERFDSFGFGFVGYFLFIFFSSFVFTLLCVTSSYVCSYIRMAVLCCIQLSLAQLTQCIRTRAQCVCCYAMLCVLCFHFVAANSIANVQFYFDEVKWWFMDGFKA